MYERFFKNYEIADVTAWKTMIPDPLMTDSVKGLFTFWRENCEMRSTKTTDELIKMAELFSLLENVFRNALLRPYIPAYRTINTKCGRYCFSETEVGESLFWRLKLSEKTPGRLTYEETNPAQTVVYALTCFVFWHILSLRIKSRC